MKLISQFEADPKAIEIPVNNNIHPGAHQRLTTRKQTNHVFPRI